MSMVKWNVAFLLGIEELDQHHKHLVDLLNLTHEGYKQGAQADTLRHTVEQLVDYSNYHFSCEERLMADTVYPDFPSHKKEHEVFASRVRELRDSFHLNSNISLELMSFLSNWFTYHILVSDIKFGHFVEEENLRKRITSMKLAL